MRPARHVRRTNYVARRARCCARLPITDESRSTEFGIRHLRSGFLAGNPCQPSESKPSQPDPSWARAFPRTSMSAFSAEPPIAVTGNSRRARFDARSTCTRTCQKTPCKKVWSAPYPGPIKRESAHVVSTAKAVAGPRNRLCCHARRSYEQLIRQGLVCHTSRHKIGERLMQSIEIEQNLQSVRCPPSAPVHPVCNFQEVARFSFDA